MKKEKRSRDQIESIDMLLRKKINKEIKDTSI
jgi:hypothetical protein